MSSRQGFTIETLPANSAWARELCEHGVRKHYVKSLLEVDVTRARKAIRSYRADTGRDLSFFSWIVKTIADAVDQHKAVHALRYRRNRVLIFDEVDISIPVEREIDGKRMPMPYVLRQANRKPLQEINDEIAAAQTRPLSGDEQVLSKPLGGMFLRAFPSLPGFLKSLFWSRFDRDPFLQKRIMGTVGITSVAIAGGSTAWALPISIQPVCFALGSLTRRSVSDKGAPVTREYLALTAMFDHDVIDGAPAARFVSQLTKAASRAYGLAAPPSHRRDSG